MSRINLLRLHTRRFCNNQRICGQKDEEDVNVCMKENIWEQNLTRFSAEEFLRTEDEHYTMWYSDHGAPFINDIQSSMYIIIYVCCQVGNNSTPYYISDFFLRIVGVDDEEYVDTFIKCMRDLYLTGPEQTTERLKKHLLSLVAVEQLLTDQQALSTVELEKRVAPMSDLTHPLDLDQVIEEIDRLKHLSNIDLNIPDDVIWEELELNDSYQDRTATTSAPSHSTQNTHYTIQSDVYVAPTTNVHLEPFRDLLDNLCEDLDQEIDTESPFVQTVLRLYGLQNVRLSTRDPRRQICRLIRTAQRRITRSCNNARDIISQEPVEEGIPAPFLMVIDGNCFNVVDLAVERGVGTNVNPLTNLPFTQDQIGKIRERIADLESIIDFGSI